MNPAQAGDLPAAERHVVLVAPDVPWNTGNIGRTCIGTGARLHLIKPLGFSIQSRDIKRAGLDYWPKVKLSVWENFESFRDACHPKPEEIYLFSKTGPQSHWAMPIRPRMFLVFGSETRGLPPEILAAYAERIYRIPISAEIRSLNLSTAVGIALYETYRSVT